MSADQDGDEVRRNDDELPVAHMREMWAATSARSCLRPVIDSWGWAPYLKKKDCIGRLLEHKKKKEIISPNMIILWE